MENQNQKRNNAKRILKGCAITTGVFVILLVLAFFGLKPNVNTDGMYEADFEHFTFYYEELQDETIRDMHIYLDEMYDAYADEYRLPADTVTDVIVYRDLDDYQRASMGLVLSMMYRDQNWMVGGANQGSIIMASPESPDIAHSYDDMLEIVQHEYIHVLNRQLNENNKPSRWLDEGLAVLLSGQGEQQSIPDAPLPTLTDIESWNDAEFGNNGGYYYSYAFCDYLIDQVGLETVLQIVKTDDYEGVVGKSFEVIYDEWAATIENQ